MPSRSTFASHFSGAPFTTLHPLRLAREGCGAIAVGGAPSFDIGHQRRRLADALEHERKQALDSMT